MLVRDELLAAIIQEALEGYASGRFQLQVEVKRFLESHPEYPCDRIVNVDSETVIRAYESRIQDLGARKFELKEKSLLVEGR